MEKDLTPEEIEKHNNRKLTADKIRQILSKVLETPTQSIKINFIVYFLVGSKISYS
jgi:hypothetical protein